MASKTATPGSLARDLSRDVDDVLLLLWDAGIEYPVGAQSRIKNEDLAKAKAACGITPIKDRLLVAYWLIQMGMERNELTAWAFDHGVVIGENARRLPKGALAKFDRATKGSFTSRISSVEPRIEEPRRRPIDMRIVGHSRDRIRHLIAHEIEAIHYQIADDFWGTPDPIAPAGVRSNALLDSAAGRSSTGMGGFIKYPTVEMAGAALMHSVIHNHPFYNGNKRTALVSVLAFLDENGLVLESSQTDVFKWTVRIAGHKLGAEQYEGDRSDVEVQLMASWLVQRCRNVEAGERVITFAELRRRLQAFDCDLQPTSNRGGKVMVSREVGITEDSIFGQRVRKRIQRFPLPFGGDGRQVSRHRIKEMRQQLQLTDEFGIDSASFYGSVKQPVDAFIAQYRKTLRRLAKL